MMNLIERALWTGVQSGLALLSVDSLFDMGIDPFQTLAVAGVATLLSAIKTFSQGRLLALGGSND